VGEIRHDEVDDLVIGGTPLAPAQPSLRPVPPRSRTPLRFTDDFDLFDVEDRYP